MRTLEELMEDLGGPSNGGERPLFQSRRRKNRERRSPVPLVLGLAFLLLTSAAVWLLLRSGDPDAIPTAANNTDSIVTEPADPVLELPELDASDAMLRQVLAQLSEHPEWAAWLIPDDLVRRFFAAVVNVAEGDTPRSHVDFLQPSDSFQVSEAGDRLVIDPQSYRRYDLFAETFVSLDTGLAARYYRLLNPLFEDAHRELGLRERTFDESFALALGNLTSSEPAPGEVDVVQNEAVYEFLDPALEGLSPAQKHMLRLGPRNARRVQDKLRELSGVLGIQPTVRAPVSR